VGFLASDRPAPDTAIEAAAGKGIDLMAHRSERVDADRIRAADLIVVMDPRQARRIRVTYGPGRDQVLILADLLPAFAEGRTIPDPIEKPLEVFQEVYGQIDHCLAAMRSALRGA
jgi:protein-tyrosine-phosphatase